MTLPTDATADLGVEMGLEIDEQPALSDGLLHDQQNFLCLEWLL
jgi:hypothetical protein